jgi:hypothetical protein
MSTTSPTGNRTSPKTTGSNDSDLAAGERQSTPQQVVSSIKDAADAATTRVPEAASTTLDAMNEARRAIRSGTDEGLTAGTILSFGLAMGLLLGGANRLHVLAALVPAAAMGTTLLERTSRAARRGMSQRDGAPR